VNQTKSGERREKERELMKKDGRRKNKGAEFKRHLEGGEDSHREKNTLKTQGTLRNQQRAMILSINHTLQLFNTLLTLVFTTWSAVPARIKQQTDSRLITLSTPPPPSVIASKILAEH